MIKKIMYYKTLSPTEMYISIERLSYILFGFSGKFENVDGKRRFSKDQKIISMDIENGFIDFEDTLKIHSKDPRKRRELPKNENNAKKLCNDFFLKKGEILKNDQILKKSFFYFFDDLHFISAIPIQNNIYENPRIDHWECHFNVDLKVSDNNNERSILKNSSIIIKLANNGRVIAFHYHFLPVISYRFAERIETSQTEIINFYQKKVKNLQKTQPIFLKFLLELNDKVDKLMELPDEKLSQEKKEEFDHLMVHAFDKSDGYGMTYRVPYFKGRQKFLKGLDKETSDLYMEDSDKVNQKIVFLTDKVTNSILPYYEMTNSETNKEVLKPATKYKLSEAKPKKKTSSINIEDELKKKDNFRLAGMTPFSNVAYFPDMPIDGNEFVRNTIENLHKIYATDKGKKVIDFILNHKNYGVGIERYPVTYWKDADFIQYNFYNNTLYYDSISLLYWFTEEWLEFWFLGNGSFTPLSNLAHELYHAYQHACGNFPRDRGSIVFLETGAVKFTNYIRSVYDLGWLRTGYSREMYRERNINIDFEDEEEVYNPKIEKITDFNYVYKSKDYQTLTYTKTYKEGKKINEIKKLL